MKAGELLSTFSVIARHISGSDGDAVGAFVLSMTRSADDLLAVYLLAQYCGLSTASPSDPEMCLAMTENVES
ncbi:phosphoenolpyruvate carboxylase, partial [Mesorhizobium sp. M4A.F.Ca.ET.050.02.1.1]|uniref:phosphoenolpyruvate carboxylase n=1 Tax=Mesorhizobium sp. M4A.F.Ca.ET.050.02.1.1 TaxID=2496754 RepID=UPI0032AF0640